MLAKHHTARARPAPAALPPVRRYRYRGDRLTAPEHKNQHCSAVLQPDGKCITGNSAMLVQFDDGTQCVVQRRQLRRCDV